MWAANWTTRYARLAPMRRICIFLTMALFAGCGGKTTTDDDGGTPSTSSTVTGSGGGSPGGANGTSTAGGSTSASTGPSGAASSSPGQPNGRPVSTLDAGSAPVGIAPPPKPGPCSMGSGGGFGGGGGSGGTPSCQITSTETCSGTSYQVTCACPQGTCACFGAATTVVSFPTCPACPNISQAFALCGFPQ